MRSDAADGSERMALLQGMAYELESTNRSAEGCVHHANDVAMNSESADARQMDVECARTTGASAPPSATPGQQVLSLLKPVCVTMALVVFLAHALGKESVEGGFSSVMVYEERDSDSAATKAQGVMLNALVLVGDLFLVTTGLYCLYKLRCYRIIYGWLYLSVAVILFGSGAFVTSQLLNSANAAVDVISFYFAIYNYAAVGTLVVFWEELGLGEPPSTTKQAYLVLISALMAWSATTLSEWTTWGLLAAVALWDVVAVLTPHGPLRLLVEEAERRGDPIPGLVYEGTDIKLGLGDFVFYSVLVGRASMSGFVTLVACTVAVLAGLMATLALLPIVQRVLPALPISIAIGTGAYFLSASIITPLMVKAQGSSIFF